MPADHQIWAAIASLQGKTVRTIAQGKPNTILRVSNYDIQIQGRATRPTRKDVQTYCQVLLTHKVITSRNRPTFGWPGGHKTGRIIMAILADALPNHVQAFGPNNPYVPGLSGIRLTRNC